MAKLSEVRDDLQAVVEGVWHPYLEDIEVRVARWDNPELVAWYAQRQQELNELHPDGVPPEQIEALVREALAKFVVKDYRNFSWDDGTPITAEDTQKLFDTEGFGAAFSSWVIQKSQERSAYRASYVERAAGNSERP